MQENYSEQELLKMLADRHPQVIDILFRQYYAYLCNAAYAIVKDKNIAEDMAQEVFLDLWNKRENINIHIAIKAYLRRATINKSINYVKRKKVNFAEIEDASTPLLKTPAKALSSLQSNELSKLIKDNIDKLPERCRLIFRLSRNEEMTYQEIATTLDISPKTVENQISKALKLIRNAISDYNLLMYVLSILFV